MKWYLVINAERRVLAVYGAALGKEAEAKRDSLREQFPLAVIDIEEREFSWQQRPSVGEIV